MVVKLDKLDIIFDFLDFGEEDKTTIGKSEIPIQMVIKAFENCKISKGNDCLCNSGINLDLPINKELVISKSGSDIKVTYNDKNQKIENVGLCLAYSTINPPDIIDNIELVKVEDKGKIVSYTRFGTRQSFEVSPLKLYRYTDKGKLNLCLAVSRISFNSC